MNRVSELETELLKAKARIAELEKYVVAQPLTIGRIKKEIAKIIGVEFDGAYNSTITRGDLLKIHAWIMERTK